MGLELAILDFLQKLHNGFLDPLMVFFTSLANTGIFWLLLAAALILFGKKEKKGWGLQVLLALAFSFLTVNVLIKPLVNRIRPFTFRPKLELLIPAPRDASFPSGHTSVSFAAAVAIYRCDKKWGQWALVLAVIIAFSRLYLYVHFPTDVLFGAAMGVLCGCASNFCFKKIAKKAKGEQI